jgi:gliding motility-associated-like protein/uncharacterized repeat protein (TIGR01451 family)
MTRKLVLLVLLVGFALSAKAQLSDLHYLPPLKQGINNQGIRDQAVYLSTPEPTNFDVEVYRGTSLTPFASYTISNNTPQVVPLADGDNNITLVNNANTGIVLNNSGLRFVAPSGNRFYVNYRGSSSAQSASLTSKGRKAMGTNFKWGGVPNLGGFDSRNSAGHRSKSNTLGIMATEDNTTVVLSDYDPDLEFRVGNDPAGITADTYTITLDANESFVFENYLGNVNPTLAQQQGWIGASIVADKNIVISNGAMNFGRQNGSANRDAGIDQPVPIENIGTEYVFVRGKGNTNGWTEFPLLIATADNTEIYINGNATPIATIDDGEFFQVPSSFYSSNAVGANMYVQTTEAVYAYQCLAGHSRVYTTGLNFVAPVNCLLPDVMDNIPDITNMAGIQITGGLTIIASTSTPDTNIVVNDGNGAVTLPASNAVAGTGDWKTYFIPNLSGNVSVQSTGPMAVGFFGYDGAKGVAGYFSGFDTVPQVDLEIRGSTGCFVGSTIFEATGNFDAYQWYKGDNDNDDSNDELIVGANDPSLAPTIAGIYYVKGVKGPCEYKSNTIKALYCDPDVIINKTVDQAEIMEGETATFTIHVENLGVGPLTNLQITDDIPNGLTLVSHTATTGSWSGNTWNIGTLEGGEIAELELEVQADEIDTLPLLSVVNTAINTQDQTDTNTTKDNPSAQITIHNDFDNDGVRDITDLDDDNDGIYDTDECTNLDVVIANGSSYTSALTTVSNYLIFDIFSLDNSFNLQINGTDLAGEVQFQNSSGNFARFLDGTGYGEGSNPNIWTITGSPGSPLLRVIVDQQGNFQLFGTRITNGPLELMQLTTPANPFTWNTSGSNTVLIQQDVVGPTNMTGTLLTASCDTDSDNYPDHLDLDSDNDGCSDANEFYKDDSADGNDGGEYGTGAPAVDINDGTVNSASYIKVLAPIILLGNTSEDLAGTDINGQALNLGQTFNYVLRFQNTGDDGATNYSIRNILPNNVTLDNIDVSNAIGTTSNYDPNTREIIFTVPDNLVNIGDPEYKILITVTLSLNCSDFVDACSSELQNLAFSTYQGVTNSKTFTDENNSNATTGCPVTPNVASNSILNDISNCNQARTVQLCGDDVLLSAGQGFSTYTWYNDSNGNGQIDGSDSIVNDGDSDNNPSTLLVTDIGDFIVEKASGGSCPDLIERITVVRFGDTQTNPIVDYFNKVNSDSNTVNDLQGEIVTCSIDGDTMANIFLCGSDDEANIQLGIGDAQSITWQKLNEGSCADSAKDCANKNGTCTWADLTNSNNFTATDSGEYRIVIVYQNGCFSRFYFNVFKNELDIEAKTRDILCTTPGNIRVTNIGTGYGFQLLNASNNDILVPFSAKNGPSFDITVNGTYKVQVTQTNPSDNSPIPGACIFETQDIGIIKRNFNVVLNSTAQDCNNQGTISVQALNALPNYNYELRLDDGSNGGLGSPVAKVLASSSDTHTFSNLNSGNYIVLTTTVDGCTDSQTISVDRIPDLTLGAVTSANITCTPGVVNLTPNGGLPSPAYEMALWSVNGSPLYTDESLVPDSEFTTVSNFTFGDTGNPYRDGDYEFIVRDGNGCFGISKSVTVLDLGTISISATDSGIQCADSATATLTVSATGGLTPYQYSLDGGTNYQDSNIFSSLPAGIYTITVRDSSGTTGTTCVENFDYEITQPFRLSASPAIIEDGSCNAAGALVKILNVEGGQSPYDYSFDGGSSFASVDTQTLLPGTYQFVVKDALGCTLDLDLTVPNTPLDPSFNTTVDYDCDGLGTITVTPSNTVDFDYAHELNGTANSPDDNPIFTDVTSGTQTVTVTYSNNLTPNQSTLVYEDFGAGRTTQIAEIGPAYCFEPQNGSTTNCNLGPAGIMVTGEYAVTNLVTNPVATRRSPKDKTGLADGRFLAIDITASAAPKGILWQRKNIEVLPNRDITISFGAYNRLRVGSFGNNPEVLVELVDGSGTVINSEITNQIPKNVDADDWHERTVTFNPGANTSVDIVFRSNLDSDYGNLLALDDIRAFQKPEICEKTVNLTVVVEDNKEFSAQLIGVIEPSCNGANDGEIRFEVANFDAATGFQYSIDGTTWTTSTVSPVTTSLSLTAGSYTVQVQRMNETTCATDFNATLNEPVVISPALVLKADYTCQNAGGTLQASATGGTPGYEYQLEDTAGTEIVAYKTNSIFQNVSDGTYLVRVRDKNGCMVLSSTPITVDPPNNIVFDLFATACYDGLNNATITATVTDGNADYKFRITKGGISGAWIVPNPASSLSHTFDGLSDGTYTIEVRDGFGCTSSAQTTTIEPDLFAQVIPVDITACADGSITVNAQGGDGNYRYAFLPAGTVVLDTHFAAANSYTVTSGNSGNYDVYVRDNGGIDPRCEYMETVTIDTAPTLTFNAVPTNAICYGDKGNIAVSITDGEGPFTYELVDVDNGTSSQTQSAVLSTTKTYFNLSPGAYNIIITDKHGCTQTVSRNITQPEELTATISGITPANCTGDANDFGFAFSAYPSTLGTIEFSADGGSTWVSDNSNPGVSDQLTGYVSGSTVYPSMRTVDGGGATVCQTNLEPFIIPYPLDDLDITILPILVSCNELQVTVRGQNGTAPYFYTYTEDPANFNPNLPDNPWVGSFALGTTHTFTGLTPGRTYSFYVRDSSTPLPGCVRQSNVNVNELVVNPMDISASAEPSCFGANDGQITYTITDTDGSVEPQMNWTLYDINDNPISSSGGNIPYNNTINISGLAANTYYIVVTQVDSGGVVQCTSASENLILNELDAISASLNKIQDITCEQPGIFFVEDIVGGGGTFTYTVTGPAPFSTITGTPDNPIEIAANSPQGNYNVVITDQFGCTANLGDINLNLAEMPTITSLSIDTCPAQNTVTIVGSSPAFPNLLYSIDGGATYFDNGGVFNNVPVGPYTAVVKNSAGCTIAQVFTVFPGLQASTTRVRDLGCGPGQEAEIQIEISEGSGNYEYEILDSANTATVTKQAVPSTSFTEAIAIADIYTVKIYDTSSDPECARTFTVEIPAAVVPDFSHDVKNVTCFGGTDGSITLTQLSTGSGLTYTMNPNLGSFDAATSTFSNLPAGAYDITAQGGNNCTTAPPLKVTVMQPNQIVFDLPNVTQFACASGNVQNNATITIDTSSILEGSGTYTVFEFEEATSGSIQTGTATNYTFTDLAGGDVIVRVFDDVGCSAEHTVTVNAFDELISTNVNIDDPISCVNAGEDISIEVTGSLSNSTANPANYEYKLLPSGSYQTSNSFVDLAVGTHTFAVRNVNTNCEFTFNHNVDDPNTFDFNIDKIADVVCYGDYGSVQLSITDATYSATFTYHIYNTNGTPNDRTDDTVEIGPNSASVGTTPPIAVPAGNYLVEVVQDGFPECRKFKLFNIATPSAPLSLDVDLESVGCSNDRGTAHIQPIGGEGPFEITLTNNTTSTTYPLVSQVNTHLFQNLSAGQYTVLVTDNLGCTQTFTNEFELTIPPSISGTITTVPLACFGDSDASATYVHDSRVATPPLTPNYRYIIHEYNDSAGSVLLSSSASQNNATFGNLRAGFYGISVADDYNCDDELRFEIVEPNETEAQLTTVTEFSCTVDAELLLKATGGTAPYQWSIDGTNFNTMNEINGANSHLFQNVTDGSYQYYVQDSFNCISIISNEVKINEIITLSVTIDSSAAVVNCYNESTAVIDAAADGGLGNYRYELYTDTTLINQVGSTQSNGLFTDLPANTYYVHVVSEDCPVTSEAIVIDNPDEILIDPIATPVACFGDESGSIFVEASGGSGEFQFAISPNLNQFVDDNLFEGLAAGMYTILVQDKNNGCPQYYEIEITAPTKALSMSLTPMAAICTGDANGAIEVEINGGTPPYSTAINSDDDSDFVQGRLSFDNLEAGDYHIFVKDANGCPIDDLIRVDAGVNLNASHEVIYECSSSTPSNRIELTFEDETTAENVLFALDSTDPSDLQLENDFENMTPGDHFIYLEYQGCNRRVDFSIEDFGTLQISVEQLGLNEITATASGGKADYTYYFDDIDNGNDNVYYITRTATYTVRVVDANGCEAVTTIDMEFIDIEIPKFFTPDGDGQNDLWIPKNIEQFPNIFIKIFDRYGREVYRIEDSEEGWNGFYQEATLPTGDYWYIIKLNGEEDKREFVGNFTLYR